MKRQKKVIQDYSLKDILNVLGEEEQSTELHINLNTKAISENIFPYPFRSDNICLMLVLKGKIKMQLNLVTHFIEENDIICFYPGTIIHTLEIIECVESTGVIFTQNFAQKRLMNRSDFNILRFSFIKEKPICKITPQKRDILFPLFKNMYHVNVEQDTFYKKDLITHYFNLIALEFMKIYKEEFSLPPLKSSHKNQLLLKFLNLLETYSQKERSVQFYAQKLSVTSDYLSKVTKEISGISAREVIEEIVIMEAIELLNDLSLSIAQIAERLHFSDQSFFGKFFKKKMKLSPKAYRQQYK